MRRIVSAAVSCVLVLAALSPVQAAQPASKATAKVGNIAILGMESVDWQTILANEIRTPNGKDLFIDVSLECGLYTETEVESAGGLEEIAEAEAGVQVKVLVDGVEALPGEIHFCKRSQTLKAAFQGLIVNEETGEVCLAVDPITGAIVLDEECLSPERVGLILDTMNASSFNFIAPDLTSGVHLIEVQAKISSATMQMSQTGAKVKDKDEAAGDFGEEFLFDDVVLTVDKEGKIDPGEVIILGAEEILVSSVSGKNLEVERGYNGTTAVTHPKDTRIYRFAEGGATANASIGKGSMTVELVRMIRDEDIILEE